MRTALDQLMAHPSHIMAIRSHLHVGQEVEHLDMRDNRMRKGRVIEFKPDQLLIHAEHDLNYRWTPYASVQIDSASMPAQQAAAPVPARREDFAVGDSVSFET